MDDQQSLVTKGTLAVAVMGHDAGEEFAFIHFDGGTAADFAADIEEVRAKGFIQFAGLIAIVNGQPVANCNPGSDNLRVMMNAAFAYAQMVCERIKPPHPEDDFTAFAERLWSLEDPRD